MTEDLLNIASLDDTHLLVWALEALARTCQDLCAAQAESADHLLTLEQRDRLLALLVLSVSLLSHLRKSLDRLATCSTDGADAGAPSSGPVAAAERPRGKG